MIAEPSPDVEAFLAHYGVKGMKWGRRKSGSESNSDRAQQFKSTAKKVAVGAAIAAGAAAVAVMAAKSGSTPMSSISVGRANLSPTAWDRVQEIQKMNLNNFNLGAANRGKTHFMDLTTNQWSPQASASTAVARRSAGSLVRT